MRLALRIDRLTAHRTALCAAVAAALTLCALSAGVNAQESAPILSASTVDAAPATLASPAPAAVAEPAAPAAADEVAFGFTLDDQILSRQRGGAVGMLMVAATPQLVSTNSGNNSVTLWDEIAPPSPMPIPVDVARSAQGNVTTYQRN
jgi:hypothetical protein